MFSTRLILVLIFLLLCIPIISATTIHGTIYEWSTFKPLDNALIEINTTPVQFRVATSGIYSFNLEPGDYLIKTCYYSNDILEYYSEDVITITNEDGDYVLDILLFPIEEEKEEEILFEEDIANLSFDINEESTLPKFNWIYTSAAIIVLILAVVAAYYHYHKVDITTPDHKVDITTPDHKVDITTQDHKVDIITPDHKVDITTQDHKVDITTQDHKVDITTQDHSRDITTQAHREDIIAQDKSLLNKDDINKSIKEKDAILPDDLKEIIEILKNSHGRITQKELRIKLKCSEAKVSLMITDLEARGLVQKIKKGRGNIIIFTAGLIL